MWWANGGKSDRLREWRGKGSKGGLRNKTVMAMKRDTIATMSRGSGANTEGAGAGKGRAGAGTEGAGAEIGGAVTGGAIVGTEEDLGAGVVIEEDSGVETEDSRVSTVTKADLPELTRTVFHPSSRLTQVPLGTGAHQRKQAQSRGPVLPGTSRKTPATAKLTGQ